MVETAQTIKKTVEEGKIDGIIDKACCSQILLTGFSDFKNGVCVFVGL